jgi:hypothetical protein
MTTECDRYISLRSVPTRICMSMLWSEWGTIVKCFPIITLQSVTFQYSTKIPQFKTCITTRKKTPWPESAGELYRPSDRSLSAKLVPTSTARRCHVVTMTDPYGRILGFLDRSRYFFFQVAPQLCSRGWMDPVPDPLLLRKSGSSGNRTRDLGICNQELWPLGHRGGQ